MYEKNQKYPSARRPNSPGVHFEKIIKEDSNIVLTELASLTLMHAGH